MVKLPSPIHDNYWRNRLLTEEEYAQTIEAAKAIVAKEREKAMAFGDKVKEFLSTMEEFGFTRSSPEYKYVSGRIQYRPRFDTLVMNIEWAQKHLRQKAEEEKRQQEEAERQRERMVTLAEEARSLWVDPIAYFGDEKGLKQAIRAAKEAKFDEALRSAPYYVKASFYGHCLRGDWSMGRDSYGCEELEELEIPAEDPERSEIHALVVELKEIAAEWDGEDGRDFRYTYQRLDALLSEEEGALLEFLDKTFFDLYGW